jgi:hypothetical protein
MNHSTPTADPPPPLTPCGQAARDRFRELAAQAGADEEVWEVLRPLIADPRTLTPLRYWALLTEAQTVLQRLGAQGAVEVVTRAAALLAEELRLLPYLEQRRRSPTRA